MFKFEKAIEYVKKDKQFHTVYGSDIDVDVIFNFDNQTNKFSLMKGSVSVFFAPWQLKSGVSKKGKWMTQCRDLKTLKEELKKWKEETEKTIKKQRVRVINIR